MKLFSFSILSPFPFYLPVVFHPCFSCFISSVLFWRGWGGEDSGAESFLAAKKL